MSAWYRTTDYPRLILGSSLLTLSVYASKIMTGLPTICWVNAGITTMEMLQAGQLLVYTKNSSRNWILAWVGANWAVPSIACGAGYAEVGNLCCVALAVSFSGFHSSRCLICCTHWTVMLISSLLWQICSSLDSGLLATAVEVSIITP